MKELTIREIANGAKGTLVRGSEEQTVKRIVIDSREARAGDLFIAIIGERQDGHKFAKSAVEAGCRALLLSDDSVIEEISEAFRDVAVIKTDNTVKGLQELARWYLSQFSVKRLAVTGSTGKTTTKEMLYTICSARFRTVCNRGNLNNEIGMPLSAFLVEEDTEVAIFEMGMSSMGEIRVLADIVRPQIGIITNIGTSHIEFLKSQDNILLAKMEITDFMSEDDLLIVNSDNPYLTTKAVSACMQDKYRENYRYGGNFDIVTAGENVEADCYLSELRDLGDAGIAFRLEFQDQDEDFRLPLLGQHNAYNAMVAVAAAMSIGVTMREAEEALAEMTPTARRLNVEEKNGIKLIDDTYNASPDSMMAAVDVLSSVAGRRKIAIFADILEMGDAAPDYHKIVGIYGVKKKLDVIIAIGPSAKYIAEGARSVRGGETRIIWHETKEPVLAGISQMVRKGDVVLVKGSNSTNMTEVADAIRSLQ